MLGSPTSQGLERVWDGTTPNYNHLDERDATLHQRRSVEDLLAAFTKGQLTRHYWGHFASTLADLGLSADSSLGARVETADGATRLWLTPQRGEEAYLAQVSFNGAKLARLHCRGISGGEVEPQAGRCPAGWEPLKEPAS